MSHVAHIILQALRPFFLFFFNDTATTEIYTLSLHDALPICDGQRHHRHDHRAPAPERDEAQQDRKSTRLNSSHHRISYAVFCLKKKNRFEERRREEGRGHQGREERKMGG